jgi:predicted metal-dependent phosphoesterase TrpH
VIDLHTHTTASDGRTSPEELVDRAAVAGVDILAVTDHDTVAGCACASAACAARGIEFLTGIEVTAVADGVDVHVLGYFIDAGSRGLASFLATQRQRRLDRIRQMVERLARLGMPLDADAIVAPGLADSSKAIGRPYVARALVAAGFVPSVKDAFDRFLSPGRPAFVPRLAATPSEVISKIHEAGGLASMAHPGLTRRDGDIPVYVEAGLDALEAFHPEHDSETTRRYLTLADQLGVAVTGGSDFHGDDAHGAEPGAASLPRERYDAFKALRRHPSS